VRCDVRRLAEDLAIVSDHYRAGVQADAHGQARPVPSGECGVEQPQGVHDRQARPDRAFRVVLARGGPAEVDEQAIAELAGDVAAEAPDGAGCGLLILREEVAPLLGVELLRERRRADQVAEEHRELAALARCSVRCWQRRLGTPWNRRVLAKRGATVPAELLARLDYRSARLTSAAETTPALRAMPAVRAVPMTARRAAERAVTLHERLRVGGPKLPASPPRAGSVSTTEGPDLAGHCPTGDALTFHNE
jgi:hypothetical protein